MLRLLAIVLIAIVFMGLGCTEPASDDGGDWPSALGAPLAGERNIRVLQNEGFAAGYDLSRQRAAWVAYRASAVGSFVHMPRPQFQPDPRLGRAPDMRQYAGPEYDRGHLAPNYAISQLYGRGAQRRTFYYSNIVPQRPRLNQLVWQRLEEIEIDDIAPRVGTLWVLVGPVPGAGPSARNGPPAAFFRIWLARGEDGSWQALAFRLPQEVRGDEHLDRYRVSIDALEAATGLNFFARLDDVAEKRIEARPASPETFGFAEWACQPARYGRRWQGRDDIRLRYDRCGTP